MFCVNKVHICQNILNQNVRLIREKTLNISVLFIYTYIHIYLCMHWFMCILHKIYTHICAYVCMWKKSQNFEIPSKYTKIMSFFKRQNFNCFQHSSLWIKVMLSFMFCTFSQDIIITLHKTYVNFSNVLTGLRKMPYAENKKQLI